MKFEEIWEYREEKLYKEFFGEGGEGIYPISAEIFSQDFQQTEIDPRWLTYGILEFKPNKERDSWLYVSSGMSNPWEDDEQDYQKNEQSGLGMEFTFETTASSKWAIILLQKMVAYNILIACGRMKSEYLIDYGDRIPLKSSIMIDKASAIRNVVVGPPTHFPASFQLYSGKVELLHFIGVTDEELAFAKQHSTKDLIDRLTLANACPVTDPFRQSII